MRDSNEKMEHDTHFMRKDAERITAENFITRKEGEVSGSRNTDLACQIRAAEERMREKEIALAQARHDIERQRLLQAAQGNNSEDLHAQKEALERHAQVLNSQNMDLTGELERFCKTDEMLRSQLDRRQRVHGI